MSAHRYWRVSIYGTVSGGFAAFSEVQFRTAVGGASVTSGGTALASSEFNGSTLKANAYDGSSGTIWMATAATGYIGYDFGSGNDKDILQAALTSRNDASFLDCLSIGSVDYSDDGSTWTSATGINATTWTQNETKTFLVQSSFVPASLLVDSSSYARILTAQNGATASQATYAAFGPSGLWCYGTGGSSSIGYGVTAPSSADFDFGAGNFTLDCRAVFLETTAGVEHTFISRWTNSTSTQQFSFSISFNTLQMSFIDTAGATRQVTGAWTPTLGVKYHVAGERSGTTLRVYVDGVVKGTITGISPAMRGSGTAAVAVGYQGGIATTSQMKGVIDEVRISNVARYSGAFTPAATAYTSDANTLLLAHFDAVSVSTARPQVFICC